MNINENIDKTISFANESYRLMYLIRYNIYPRNVNENVANHIAQVSLLSLYLGESLKDIISINMEKVLKLSVTHDLPEVNGMDIVHKLKVDYPKLKELAEEIELTEMERLLGQTYKEMLIEFNSCKTVESIIVNVADVISCMIYSQEEIKLGNTYFNRVYKESSQRLDFLKLKLHDMIKNGEESI